MNENIKLIINKKNHNISNIIDIEYIDNIIYYPKPKFFNLYEFINNIKNKILKYLIIFILFISIIYMIFK